ncbi:zinc ribbon domain-containing protein [Mycobacterium sp. BMJ-28]
MITAVFPGLPRARRTPFLLALLLVVTALTTFAVLRWQAPMIGTAVAGFALVFGMYVRTGDHPARGLAATALFGAVLGVGWAIVAGQMVAQAYDVALGSGTSVGHTVLEGIAIPVGGAVLMLLPAVAARLVRGLVRNPLSGYVFGALGATTFTVATTATRLSPQLAMGVSTRERPVWALLGEAGIQGIAAPLMAAAVGGTVGAALGYQRHRTAAVAASVLAAAALYGGLGLIEDAPLPQSLQVGAHLALAALALLGARTVMRAAPAPEHAEAAADRGRARVLLPVGAGIGIAAVVAAAVSIVITPVLPNYRCPPDCGRPPLGTPVATNPRFTASDGSFSVSYPGPGTAYQAILNPDGVTLDFVAGDTGTLELFGEPARGRTPRVIAEELIARSYPDATVDYEIPNAAVGYQPGYGIFADDYPQDSTGTYTRLRIMVVVAVKNDLALVASAVGPYHEFSPSFGIGHPSGANLQLAMDIGKYVNSFSWRGDPPR